MPRLCDYCEEHRVDDPQVCPGSKPYEHYGADACTGFSPVHGARCCKCGEASGHMGLVLGEHLVCFSCMEAFLGTDDGLFEAYDPAHAELTDLIVELEGLG